MGLFDSNDQLYTLDSDSDCVLYSNDLNLSMTGNTKVKAENGTYTFSQINLIARPDYRTNISFMSSSIKNKYKNRAIL